jgi:hypothetical protein
MFYPVYSLASDVDNTQKNKIYNKINNKFTKFLVQTL